MKDLVYFTQTDKGLMGKTAFGKVVFPERKSNLKKGFAEIEFVVNKDNYAFVTGRNISSNPYTDEDLFQLFVDEVSDIHSIKKGKTKDGIQALIIEKLRGEHKTVVFENGKWSPRYPLTVLFPELKHYDISYYNLLSTITDVKSKEEIQQWKSEYMGRNWSAFPFPEEVTLDNPLEWLTPELSQKILKYAHIGMGYKIPYMAFDSVVHMDLLQKVPVTLDTWGHWDITREQKQELLQAIRKENILRLSWWKKEGLNLIHSQPEISDEMVEAIKRNLETAPLWNEV